MTKQKLLQRVIETVMQERKKAEESLATTRQAAIDAPGAMQSHSDTTKSQMSRLAEEIERSIEEKNFALRTLQGMAHSGLPSDTEVIKIGSVVEVLTERGEREIYFILPVGGGIEIVDNDRTITVATVRAPIAIALIGKRQSQTVRLQIGSLQKELTIVGIQ